MRFCNGPGVVRCSRQNGVMDVNESDFADETNPSAGGAASSDEARGGAATSGDGGGSAARAGDGGVGDAVAEHALEEVRRICHGLPSVTERPSHGAPTFFINDKKSFLMFHDDHHGDGRLAVWCAAPMGVQATLVETEPERFFVPAYVGYRGWIGLRLDVDPEWDEVAQICADAWCTVAPKRLLAAFQDDQQK